MEDGDKLGLVTVCYLFTMYMMNLFGMMSLPVAAMLAVVSIIALFLWLSYR